MLKPDSSPSAKPPSAPSPTEPLRVDSTRLFGSRDEIHIAHGGETYRLRRTRMGKLILTK